MDDKQFKKAANATAKMMKLLLGVYPDGAKATVVIRGIDGPAECLVVSTDDVKDVISVLTSYKNTGGPTNLEQMRAESQEPLN